MPPRPFPFPINVGTDICSVHRIYRLLNIPSTANRFPKKILTTKELESRWLPLADTARAWRRLRMQRRSLGLGTKRHTSDDYYDTVKIRRWAETGDDRLKNFTERAVASDNAAGEAAITTDHDEQMDGNTPASKQLRTVDEQLQKLFPDVWKAAHFLAGRFAAKEAAMKAYQSRRLTYQDIEILSPPQRDGMSQAPIAMVRPEDGDWDNAQIIPMSISHDGGFATAVCMAYEKSPGAVFETAEEVMDAIAPKAAKEESSSLRARSDKEELPNVN